jgi:hypothetical protein
MTKLETTCTIFFIGILFMTKFVLKHGELTLICYIFVLGYLFHFCISRIKFESNVSQIDETKIYPNFSQTLDSIPVVIDYSNRIEFNTFLNKCDTKLHNEFYADCFKNDCYTFEKCNDFFKQNYSHYLTLLRETTK